MGEFEGFTKESKKFCSYKERGWLGKMSFWSYYPIAFLKFHRPILKLKGLVFRALNPEREKERGGSGG